MSLEPHSTRAASPRFLLYALLLGASACDSCAGAPVPFGLDAAAQVEAPDSPAPDARRAPPQILPAETRRVAIEGATLDVSGLSPEGALRAVWPMDVDADGDLDVLLLWTSGRRAQLSFARRGADAFEAPVPLGSELSLPEPEPKPEAGPAEPDLSAAEPEACLLDDPRFTALGAQRATVQFGLSCGEAHASRLSIVDVAETPRPSLELTATGGLGMRVEPSLGDVDDDGQEDLTLALTLSADDIPESSISLRWLDRPGGLARDPEEPGAALIVAAEAAEAGLRSDPAAADRAAAGVLALERALCSASDGPRLLVGGAPLSCASSAGAGLALAVRVAALARQGKLSEAALLERELSDPHYRLGPKGRRTLASAFRVPETPGVMRHRLLGTVTGAGGPTSALTTLAFLPDGRLALRAAPPRAYDLGLEPPVVGPLRPDEPPVRSADGRLAVRDVHRTCRGYVASVVAAPLARPGPAVMPGQDVLLAATEAPQGVSCDPLPRSMLEDSGGFSVLAWAPQGLVVARGGSLLLVPLTASGQSAGAAMPLADDAPLPAPLRGAAISADGSRWVEASPHGVILHQRGRTPSERLLPRASEDEAPPRAVAISADGRRVAYLAGDELRVLEGF